MFAIVSDTAVRTVLGTIGTAVFAGACLLAATAPANAAEAPRAQAVSYSDLNLSSAQGREALELRIKQAARNVCFTGSDDVRAKTEEARCVRSAVDGATSRMATTVSAFQG